MNRGRRYQHDVETKGGLARNKQARLEIERRGDGRGGQDVQADSSVCSLMTISPAESALGLDTRDAIATGSVSRMILG